VAEKNENSLIGYDPLAWMHEQAEEKTKPSVAVACPEADAILDEQLYAESPAEQNIADAGWQDVAVDATEEGAFADTASIVLEPVLSIQTVAQLHEQLLAVLNSSNKIEIDASAVTSADTASLQLLLVLKRTAIKQQKEVVIDFPSDKFIEVANLLGISEMLEVDRAAAGFF
jgi:ABC-type transporter Mla MlaB component